MIEIAVPGYKTLLFKTLILDYNGTIAFDGQLINKVSEILKILSDKLTIHVLTADTFGSVKDKLKNIPCNIHILSSKKQDIQKLEYVKKLDPLSSISIGNGRNDRLMLKESALGIAIISDEGSATETILSADIVCTDIIYALELLINPLRLIATLRS